MSNLTTSPVVGGGAGDGNNQVGVSSDDTTVGYLEDQIVGSANVTINVLNPGGDEQLEIVSTPAMGMSTVEVSGADTTPNFLFNKLPSSGAGVASWTILNPGGNETLELAIENIFNTSGTITSGRVMQGEGGDGMSFISHDLLTSTWTERSYVTIDDALIEMVLDQGTAGVVDTTQALIFTAVDMTVVDSTNAQGLIYAADYSGNFTARSLVDMAYADATAAAAAGAVVTYPPAGADNTLQFNDNGSFGSFAGILDSGGNLHFQDDIDVIFGTGQDGAIGFNSTSGNLRMFAATAAVDIDIFLGSNGGSTSRLSVQDDQGAELLGLNDQGIMNLATVTTAEQDAISTIGAIAANSDVDALMFRATSGWEYLSEPNTSIVYIRQPSDFGTPAGGIYTLATNTLYLIQGVIDLGSDQLLGAANTRFQGIDNLVSSITSTHSAETIQGGATTVIDRLTVSNTGAGDSVNFGAFAVNFSFRSQFTDGVAIAGAAFVSWQFVSTTGGTVNFTGTTLAIDWFGGGANNTTAIDNYVIADGAAINSLRYACQNAGISGGRGWVVSDPNDIVEGIFTDGQFGNTAGFEPLAYQPVATPASSIAAPELAIFGLAFDGTNLLSNDFTSADIWVHTGKTATATAMTVTPTDTLKRDMTVINGQLWYVAAGTGGDIYQMSGTDTGATNVADFPSPNNNPAGICFDGRNLITADIGQEEVYVHDGLTSTILETIDIAAITTDVNALEFDGENLIILGSNNVYVCQGISNVVQYSFASGNSSARGLTFTDTGWAFAANTGDTIELYDQDLTFDQSSPSLTFRDVQQFLDSTDSGCTDYDDTTGATVTINTLDVWEDVSDAGVSILYNLLEGAEKFTITDVETGEMTLNGVRDKSYIVGGNLKALASAGGSALEIEIGISVNGANPARSACTITAGTVSNSQRAALSMPPTPLRLENGDTIKMQVRNRTNTTNLDIFQSKLTAIQA